MAKLSEKIAIGGVLYKYGFSTSEIAEILGMRTPKQIITHLRKEKIKQEYNNKQSFNRLLPDELSLIEKAGYLDIIKERYPILFEENNELKNQKTPETFQF
ncbi:hypothetical protein, partial [Sutterella wadsworthensis]|uniref:hypothetical protein n=1 Tax=Sutterella wadsworthensis TaxID=40545 RepID=UPI0032BF8F49